MTKEIDILINKKFASLLNSTTDTYLLILKEASNMVAPNLPYGTTILKVHTALSNLQGTQVANFLNKCGNIKIQTAIEIITEGMNAQEPERELIQALTLLREGKNVFLKLAEDEYSKWLIFRSNQKLHENYAKAFLASILIAFCYKILGDNSIEEKAYNDAKRFFYHHIHHLSSLQRISKGTAETLQFSVSISGINSTKEEMFEYYEEILDQEKYFVQMSKKVFGKNLSTTLPEDYKKGYTKDFFRGDARSGMSPDLSHSISVKWKLPYID